MRIILQILCSSKSEHLVDLAEVDPFLVRGSWYCMQTETNSLTNQNSFLVCGSWQCAQTETNSLTNQNSFLVCGS